MTLDAVRAVLALDAQIRGVERLVLVALATHANRDSVCWPSVATLAREAGTTERHAYRVLQRLHDRGAFSRRSGGGRRVWRCFR